MARIVILCVSAIVMASAVSAQSGEDAFPGGIAACKEGRTDTARSLLSQELANPYLEAFRLFYRAESFSRDSMFREAASDLDRLLALSRQKAIVQSHPLVSLARDRYIETALTSGSCFAVKEVPFDLESLSAHSLLMLSNACFEQGMNKDAILFIIHGSRAKPSLGDSALYRKLALKCKPLVAETPHDALIAMAKGASSLRLFSEAEFFIDFLIEKNADDYPALLSKATVLSQTGSQRMALHLLWRIFYSPAPIDVKKDALEEISAVEYRLKEYDKATAHNRMFGLYYPGDARAASALDAAARIAVLRGEWKNALDTWAILRKRHATNPLSDEAALSEGTLRFSRGERREAHHVFRGLLARAKGSMIPSALYWLARTSRSEAEKTALSDSLVRAYPRSFYAMITKRGKASLCTKETKAPECDIGAIERHEKSLLDSLALRTRTDDSLMANPAYQAYVYFIDHDLLEEARSTAYALIDALEPNERHLFEVYRSAVSKGLIDLSFSVLNRLPKCERTIGVPWEFWYPAAYSGTIQKEAAARGIPADLILAVIREESKFDPQAVSIDGARGLMQLMPSTASWLAARSDSARFSPDDLFNPSVNIRMGAYYLDYLMHRYKDCITSVLAAYNAGEGKMAQWNEDFNPAADPMIALEMIGPRETRLYVKKVLDALSAYRTIEKEARFR